MSPWALKAKLRRRQLLAPGALVSAAAPAQAVWAARSITTAAGRPGRARQRRPPVLLAGPARRRYTHGALGDGVEATRVLWLERHRLELLRELVQPAPYVLEDITPRVVAIGRGSAPLTVRSGPQGAMHQRRFGRMSNLQDWPSSRVRQRRLMPPWRLRCGAGRLRCCRRANLTRPENSRP